MRRFLVVIAVVLAAACDSGPTEREEQEDRTEVPNVRMLAGAQLVTTDTAVLVDGARLIVFGDRPIGIRSHHFTEFTYGGLYEQVNDELVGEQWFVDLGRTIVSDVRGDTVFTRDLDFGDVALEGTPADHFQIDTTTVVEAGDHVRVYENLIVNRVSIYIHRLNKDGSEVTFVRQPFYEHVLAGGAVELTASGSEDVEPTAASLSFGEGVRITAIWNGEDLSFERERPVFRTDEPLVIELSRELDPDRTVLSLFYAPPTPYNTDPDIVRPASAVFQLQETTDRVVIPASALQEIASHLPEPEGAYLLGINEYTVTQDALQIVRIEAGTTENLTAVESNGCRLQVRMRKQRP
jgi:hypothetical protein